MDLGRFTPAADPMQLPPPASSFPAGGRATPDVAMIGAGVPSEFVDARRLDAVLLVGVP